MSDEKQAAPLDVGPEESGRHEFVRRAWAVVLILATVASAVAALWLASQIVLLLFAGILLAIFLRTLTDWVQRKTRLGTGWALASVIIGLLVAFVVGGWLLAAPASDQIQQLSEEFPKALEQLETELEQYAWGQVVVDQIQNVTDHIGPLLGRVTSFFSVTMEGAFAVLIIIFFGVYFAADPDLYISGFMSMLPPTRRARANAILLEIGVHLRHWLVGQIIAMTIIGIFTWLGLWALGVPLPGVLGIISGLLDFIPVVGPWIAGILSAILAVLKRPMLPVYVGAFFIGLHLLESHILIPQVQRFSTKLPPVLTILALALFTKWFGFLGLFLATPLLVLALVLIRTIYQEGVLHESPHKLNSVAPHGTLDSTQPKS